MTQKTLRTTRDLIHSQLIPDAERERIDRVIEQFSVSITPQVQQVIATSDSPAVARQFIPTTEELRQSEAESSDPIGDQSHSPVPGIIHRYEDRVLLNVLQTCAVYCRYCFRREKVGSGNAGLTPAQLNDALDYIRRDKDIWEVILSGGDPLMLSPRRLSQILRELAAMPHVGIVRFHTRVPTVAPEKITDDLIQSLQCHPAVFLVVHVNHADELTPQACKKIARLADAGLPLLSQSVLLKGVNDNAGVLRTLFRTLLVNRVKPYYLHHGDLARGTAHFRTSIATGQALMRELRGPLSGLCQPHYVLDIPGGHGKVPIGPAWLERSEEDDYRVTDVNGQTHRYRDHTNPD